MFNREQDGSLSQSTITAINAELYKRLNEYSHEKYPSEHRNHLGVSVIGDKCSRKLWYGFRWCKLEKFEARMKRLFARGHSEEEKFGNILTWMGFFVRTIDAATKRQYRFSSIGGHYGGSGDSVALLPWFRSDETFRTLVEYKTHNKKSFDKLKADKLKIAKPQHHIQMCGYAKAFGIKYGLYCAINKDDDDIYFEFLELDWNIATLMEKKAADIIGSQIPPPRLSDQPSYFECKYCNFNAICHYNEPVEINCRSCKNAKPVENAEWHCMLYGQNVPKSFLKNGCPQHTGINT